MIRGYIVHLWCSLVFVRHVSLTNRFIFSLALYRTHIIYCTPRFKLAQERAAHTAGAQTPEDATKPTIQGKWQAPWNTQRGRSIARNRCSATEAVQGGGVYPAHTYPLPLPWLRVQRR